MKKAFGYLRVSSAGQLDGDGFDRQQAMIERYAAASGIVLKGFYEEKGVSGTADIEERPAFKEMIATMLANGVRTVIVERLDRLARQYSIQEQMLLYLAAKGVELINAASGENITALLHDDPIKKALVQMQGVFAELDKATTLKKLRHGLEKKRAECGKAEGRKGWRDFPERRDEILKRIRLLRRRIKGCDRQMSFQAVGDRLNAEVLLSFTGKQWTGAGVANFFADWNKNC
jgi:DNA invertase Pin-like site-specific DNA recombinase